MLGSAPTVRQQNVRGIEASRIRLGVVQPGEQIAVFNDALGSLQNSLAYLYTNSGSVWYDTRPTLRKTVEDRATQFSASEVEYEIERRMKKLRLEPPFKGIHICPASSLDVPDDQTVRLVILSPSETVTTSSHGCAAWTLLKKFGKVGGILREFSAICWFFLLLTKHPCRHWNKKPVAIWRGSPSEMTVRT